LVLFCFVREIKDMSADEFLDGDFLDGESPDEDDSLSQDEADSDLDDNLVTVV
jgi:hypothetical protein